MDDHGLHLRQVVFCDLVVGRQGSRGSVHGVGVGEELTCWVGREECNVQPSIGACYLSCWVGGGVTGCSVYVVDFAGLRLKFICQKKSMENKLVEESESMLR